MSASDPLRTFGFLLGSKGMARKYAFYSAVPFGVFAVCGLLMAYASKDISQSVVGTYIFLGLAGISVFAWPVLLALSFQAWMRSRRR
jgi:hypothetical protein